MNISTDYNKDFYAWALKNARLIREKNFAEVDTENIAEELESMGKSEKRELINRLTVLLAYLLKWKFQPSRRSRSWNNTITVQRIDISELIKDSPSLKSEITDKINLAYEKAKLSAENETGIDKNSFPDECPFTFEEILNRQFFP